MNGDTMKAAYSELLSERGRNREACVEPEALLAVLDRTATESVRLDTLRHVGSCNACRSELDLLRTAHDAAHAAASARYPVFSAPLLAAAASVVLLAGGMALWQSLRTAGPDTLRDGAAVIVPLHAPGDAVHATAPVTFVWGSVPAARRYEFEIMRSDGVGSFTATTTDTVLTLADLTTLAPDIDYRWRVRAVMVNGSRTASAMRRLRIGDP